jgi:ankyrin repeat protein
MNALHWAVTVNNVPLLDFYIKRLGKEAPRLINVKNLSGWTPIHIACVMNKMDSVNLLLSYGADIHIKTPTGNSGLMEIVRCDHNDLLEILYKTYA